MNLNISKDWLLRMAEKEGNRALSVGGLITRVDPSVLTQVSPAEWIKSFPISVMKKLRFTLTEGISDVEALLKFFDVASPQAWQSKWNACPVAFRQTKVIDAREEAVAAWVREAEIVASDIPLMDFNANHLRSSLSHLRGLTRMDAGQALEQAQQICAKFGVAVVLVPELPGTRISGCARWLSDRHALVGLTLRYKTDDQLWFTFFHEIGHILLHRERQSFVIDNAANDMGDDVVDPEMAKFEEEANRFAADTLIPPEAFEKFVEREKFTNKTIHEFAELINVGPGTVVGRLQHEGILQWHEGNKLKQTLNWDFVPEE